MNTKIKNKINIFVSLFIIMSSFLPASTYAATTALPVASTYNKELSGYRTDIDNYVENPDTEKAKKVVDDAEQLFKLIKSTSVDYEQALRKTEKDSLASQINDYSKIEAYIYYANQIPTSAKDIAKSAIEKSLANSTLKSNIIKTVKAVEKEKGIPTSDSVLVVLGVVAQDKEAKVEKNNQLTSGILLANGALIMIIVGFNFFTRPKQ
jgi:hypothetical protein